MVKEIEFDEKLIDKVRQLPDQPGVYQYFNKEGKIIYVGKAKNLRKRVSSYFTKQQDNRKTQVLVRQISDIRHIVVDSEEDALLLENNLIKKYQPRYNVLLKDDKTFPWICVKNEPFPRVFYTRKFIRDGSSYFGPYTSVTMVRTILDVIRHLFTIRTCNLQLNKPNIQRGKFKVCLEFHIGNCKGPCEAYQEEEDYAKDIAQIKEILKGNLSSVIDHLEASMKEFASHYKFEEANLIKNKLLILENYRSKSTIFSSSITNVDVFSIEEDDHSAYINFLKMVNGAIVQAHNLEIRKRLDETKAELLALGLAEIRQKLHSDSREIILPFPIDLELKNVKIIVPAKGEKKKLLELSERNAKFYRLDRLKSETVKTPEARQERVMSQMKNDLHLSENPVHIECFDNSNIQGDSPVAACVVFKNGKPAKKEYRHFNIKTVSGPNDFASMEEIIYRRYKRLVEEGSGLPQLILIDGGKGQLGSALNSLDKLELRGKIAVVGIAKRLEEIYYPGDPVPLYLDKNSETLRVLQHLRNEAHRFGITFHRKKRSVKSIQSELDAIPGIGPKTIELLLQNFNSVIRIKSASMEDLSRAIGPAKAKIVKSHFGEA